MDKSTGYGPSDIAAKGVPIFDGRPDRFPDFKYKVTALLVEKELDVLLRPKDGIRKRLAELKIIVDAVPPATAPTDESQKTQWEVMKTKWTAAVYEQQDFNKKNRAVACIIISRLSASVTDKLRRSIPESLHFDSLEIWHWLNETYGTSSRATRSSNNVERTILNLITFSWSGKGTLSEHLQQFGSINV